LFRWSQLRLSCFLPESSGTLCQCDSSCLCFHFVVVNLLMIEIFSESTDQQKYVSEALLSTIHVILDEKILRCRACHFGTLIRVERRSQPHGDQRNQQNGERGDSRLSVRGRSKMKGFNSWSKIGIVDIPQITSNHPKQCQTESKVFKDHETDQQFSKRSPSQRMELSLFLTRSRKYCYYWKECWREPSLICGACSIISRF
jgi:hypothetical protein